MYETRTWEAVDVLGGYSPAFKIHFYLISVVIIVSLLNCFYGIAKMIRTGDHSRKKALVVQTITSAAFLGMCIWACFTAFYRTGEITVSPLSAVLMAVFFALLGITMGVYTGSFTLGKRKLLSLALPTAIAAIVTIAMYIGEMILLSGNLYRFGSGFLFEGLGTLQHPRIFSSLSPSWSSYPVDLFHPNKRHMEPINKEQGNITSNIYVNAISKRKRTFVYVHLYL